MSRKISRVMGTGPLALVAAVWQQAWRDMQLKPGRGRVGEWKEEIIADAREFLLDERALDNLASLGVDPGAVRMIVEDHVDVDGRRQRDVMRMWTGGVELYEIVKNVDYGGASAAQFEQVKRVIREEVLTAYENPTKSKEIG